MTNSLALNLAMTLDDYITLNFFFFFSPIELERKSMETHLRRVTEVRQKHVSKTK